MEDEAMAMAPASPVERAATIHVAVIVLAAWLTLVGIHRGFRTLTPGG